MNKIQLRPPPADQETEHEYASPPCLMHQFKSYFGDWSEDEEVAFLKALLLLERNGTKAFADVGRAADLRVADLVLEMELCQASFCVFIREQIAARGGNAIVSSPGEKPIKRGPTKLDLMQAISIASCSQKELSETIQAVFPKLADPGLRAVLADMQKIHDRNVERLERLLT